MTTRDERASRKSRNGSGAADDEHWRFIRAISNGDLKGLESVLISIRESPDCFKLLSRESSSGQHALHYTLSDINLQRTQELESRIEIVKSIIESISENQRLEYFNLRDTTDRRTALHTAAVHKELDVVKAILRSLPVNDRLALIDEKDGARKKVLEYALSEEIRQVIETFTRTNTSTKPTVEINNESAANNVEEWTDVRPRYPANFSDPNFDLHDNDFDTVAWPGKELGKVSSTSEPLEPESLSAEDAFKKIDDLLKQVKQDRSFAKIVHLRNKYGLTILHVAVMKNRADIVEKILTCIPSSDSHWMLISQICNHGKTALHYASMNAAITIVKLLIRYCDYKRRWDLISKICDVHKTSLHYASMAGSLDTVQELLGHCGEKDFELTRITDDKHHAPAKYAHSLEVRTLLSRVETHYWKTFFKPPTVLTFYNAFTNSVKRREGAEDEKNKMMEAFRSCGMDPKDYPDFTETMIKDKIDKAISDDNGATSALIVAVLSHGEKGMVYDADHRPIRLQRIIDIISSSSRLEFFPKVIHVIARSLLNFSVVCYGGI